MNAEIQRITDQFVVDLNAHLAERINARLADAMAISTIRVPKTRRKPPIQLCPVPECKERAAPVFGMLCGKHKDTPKKLVTKYRAARRNRKAGSR